MTLKKMNTVRFSIMKTSISKDSRERPLRLNFQVTEERINNLYNETAFNLAKSRKKGASGAQEIDEGKKLQGQIIDVLKTMDDTAIYKNRNTY